MIDAKLVLALWASLVTAGSSYVGSRWVLPYLQTASAKSEKPAVVLRKLPQMTVPILARGELQGYVVARMSIQVEPGKLKDPFEPYAIDEAFRTIYGEAQINFEKLQSSDLAKLKTDILNNINDRVKTDVARDILIEEFTYIARNDVAR